ncbi:MAG: S53 family peptidase [Vulcanisaeta sp.]
MPKILKPEVTRYVIPLIIMMTIIAMTTPIHAQQAQYLTCNGVPGSSPSHVIVWLWLSNVTTSNGLLYLLDQMYYNVSSPYFHQFITPQQFVAWYSPPSYVFSYIEGLAQQYGLTVMYAFPMLIEASGNASAVDNFLTALQSAPSNIQQWILAGECIPLGYFTSNSKVPSYRPNVIKVPLPNGVTPQYVIQHAVKIDGKPAFTVLGKPSQVLYPPFYEVWFPFGLEMMYNELPLLYSGYSGQGLTIAIVDAFGDVNFTLASQYVYQNIACNDLYTFDYLFGLPNSTCSVIYPTGTPVLTPYNLGIAEGWSGETALDVEYAHTMAPGANILLVVSPTSGDDLFTDIEYVVNNSLANFVSLSWGVYEDWMYPCFTNFLYAYDEIFMQAAAEGIGVFAGSGDWGAFDVFIIPFEPSTFYPASDPWVTGVGGTKLYAQFFNGYTQRMESAWDWNPRIIWGTGGGYSFVFNETPGQSLVGMQYELSHVYEPLLGFWFSTVGHRGVPDIAADADPFTGVLIVLNGVIPPYLIGGTSLATPLSAGMTTTIQSYLGNSFIIGDLAPSMYLIYHYLPNEAYVSLNNVTGILTSQFFTGISGAMFPTLGGDNGLYWTVPGQWSPVTGLGQLNVYGAAQALSTLLGR